MYIFKICWTGIGACSGQRPTHYSMGPCHVTLDVLKRRKCGKGRRNEEGGWENGRESSSLHGGASRASDQWWGSKARRGERGRGSGCSSHHSLDLEGERKRGGERKRETHMGWGLWGWRLHHFRESLGFKTMIKWENLRLKKFSLYIYRTNRLKCWTMSITNWSDSKCLWPVELILLMLLVMLSILVDYWHFFILNLLTH